MIEYGLEKMRATGLHGAQGLSLNVDKVMGTNDVLAFCAGNTKMYIYRSDPFGSEVKPHRRR